MPFLLPKMLDPKALARTIKMCELCTGSEDRITRLRGNVDDPKVVIVTDVPSQPEFSNNLPGVSDEYELFQTYLSKYARFDCQRHAVFIPLIFCVVPKPGKKHYEGCTQIITRIILTLAPDVIILCGPVVVRWLLSFGAAPVSMEMTVGKTLRSRDYDNLIFFVFDDPAKLVASDGEDEAHNEMVQACNRFKETLRKLR